MLIIYYLSLLFSLIIVKKTTGGILLPKLFNIVYLFFFLFIFIGGYSVYTNENFENEDSVLMATIGIILTMYLLPLGYLFSKILMKQGNKIKIKSKESYNPSLISRKGLVISIGVVIASCFLYYTYLPVIPLMSVFDSSISSKYTLAEIRSEATNSLNYSNQSYIFKILVGYRDFIQITLLSLINGYFFLKLKHNKTVLNLFIFAFFFALLVFNSISTLKKADIIFLLLLLFCINSYDNYKRNRNNNKLDTIKLFKFAGLGIGGFFLLIILYSLFMKIPMGNINLIITSIFKRIFISSVEPLYYYFSMFPEPNAFLLGQSFSPTILAGLLQYESFNIENYIFNIINPGVLERGIAGTAPTIFIGEVYSNFGYSVMIFSILLVGFLIGYLERNLENLRYSYLNVSFYIILAFTIKDISISSIQSVIGFPTIISKVLLFLLFFYLILLPMNNKKANE